MNLANISSTPDRACRW